MNHFVELAKRYNVKEVPSEDDYYLFFAYLNVMKNNGEIEIMSGLPSTNYQFVTYLSWQYWLLNDDIYKSLLDFCSRKFNFQINHLSLDGKIQTKIGIENYEKIRDEQYKLINNYIKLVENHIVYVSSYYQGSEMHNYYDKIVSTSKSRGINVEIVFQSNLSEEKGESSLGLNERFTPFINSLFFFKPKLFYVHTGWTYCKIAEDMLNVFNFLKRYKNDLEFIPDTLNLSQDSFLPPNGYRYYEYDNLTNRRTSMNKLGELKKEANYLAYLKTKNEVFSSENILSNKFKSILKDV